MGMLRGLGLCAVAVLAMLVWACDSDDGGQGDAANRDAGGDAAAGGDGGSDAIPAIASPECDQLCDDEAALNCSEGISADSCKLLCDAIYADLDESCRQTAETAYACSNDQGYECNEAGTPVQRNFLTACQDELAAYSACSSAGVTCEGETQDGTCPSIDCPCPAGPEPISGFWTDNGTCRCLTTETCLTHSPACE